MDGLRRMIVDDLDTVLAWRNHPGVREHMFDRTVVSASEHADWFASQSLRDDVELLLFERDGFASGYVRLDVNRHCSRAEWGFYKAPTAAAGTGSKMGEAVLSRVFDELDLNRLTGLVLETNVKSLHFHAKLGFTEEGILREHHAIDTRRISVHCFGLLEKEWRARRHFTDQ